MEKDMQGLSLQLPGGYNLERDPDLLILRRPDGSMVGAFSPRGAASGAVQRTPREAFEEAQAKNLRSELAASRNEEPIPVSIRPSMQVLFFGHFEMVRDGELLALGRNGQALLILKYLLEHGSHPV